MDQFQSTLFKGLITEGRKGMVYQFQSTLFKGLITEGRAGEGGSVPVNSF